jgi:ABC-type xylose transport system permease subunit
MNTIMRRWAAPTPKFFKTLRNIGIVIGGIGTALLTAPIILPASVITVSGYLVAAGSVIGVVSQLTVEGEGLETSDEQPQSQKP